MEKEMTEQDSSDFADPSGEPQRFMQFAAFASLLILFLYSGYCLQALPVVAPAMMLEWKNPASSLALPLALVSVGTAAGSVLGGLIADAKGRKFPIIGFCALQGAAMFLSGFATGPSGLYVLMLAVGLGLGGYFSSGMALLTELTNEHRRGLVISLAILFAPLGLSLCSLIAGYVTTRYGWSYIFFIGGWANLPLLLALLLLVPESPSYLARFPHRSAAHRKVLARMGLSQPQEPNAEEAKGPGLGLIGTLLNERLKASIILWVLFFVMYILGSVILGWTPVVFSTAGFDLVFASRTLFFWTMGSMAGTLLSGWCMGRIGSQKTATLFTAASVVALAFLTFIKIEPSNGALIIALLPVAGFSVAGVVTSLYTIAAETYPTAMRASGIGIADAVGRVGGILGAFAGVYVLDRAGAAGFFFAILCLAILTLAVMVLFRQREPLPAVVT